VVKYKGYLIEKQGGYVPWRSYAYTFVHDEYDGAEDSGDPRYGHAATVEECKQLIDEIEQTVAVLCSCGWGDLKIQEWRIPKQCPMCGFSLVTPIPREVTR
jgi:hypothetical protein